MSNVGMTWNELSDYAYALEEVLDALEQQERESPAWRPEYLKQAIERAKEAKSERYKWGE